MRTKQRTVVNAELRQIERARALVKQGRYRTVSDFVRESVDEKLARIDDALLEDEVARYCAAGYADEDVDLVVGQSFDEHQDSRRRPSTKKASRAAR